MRDKERFKIHMCSCNSLPFTEVQNVAGNKLSEILFFINISYTDMSFFIRYQHLNPFHVNSLFLYLPENIRKFLHFLCSEVLQKESSDMKWVKSIKSIHLLLLFLNTTIKPLAKRYIHFDDEMEETANSR